MKLLIPFASRPRQALVLLIALVAVLATALAACTAPPPAPTPDIPATVTAQVQAHLDSVPTATPAPTYTPYPTATPYPTPTTVPTATPYPTATPRPTYTPYPTATPMARPTPIPTPTPTPLPTATPAPTPTVTPTSWPTPTLGHQGWSQTGYWYRDTLFEQGLVSILEVNAPWISASDVRVATLDAISNSPDRDLWLALGCLGPLRIGYLGTYKYEVPSWVTSHSYGFWDEGRGGWSENVIEFYEPVVTDDGASIYISDRTQVNQILSMLRTATGPLPEGHILVAGMWPLDASVQTGLVAELDPTGLDDVMNYLTCFD